MRFLLDTNILVYAANRDCGEHGLAVSKLEEWLGGTVPWALTWGVVYEFFRVVTHPRIFPKPLSARQAMEFLDPILGCDLVTVLAPTDRHAEVLRQTVREFGNPAGNLFHDLHTAVLMREHGVEEIMTADTDFRKFPFLRPVDPLRT